MYFPHNKDNETITQTFILTCCQLTLVFCPYFALCLPSGQEFWNLYCTDNNTIGKYIVLSNIMRVVSDSTLLTRIQEPLLILGNIIVLPHTLSAYNSLLVRYNVYSSNPREYFCTQAEGMIKSTKTLISPLIRHHVERIL